MTNQQLAMITVQAFTQTSGLDQSVRSRLVAWFVDVARAGDASAAADVIEHVDNIDQPLFPLCDWLLSNGAGELRARRRMRCVLRLVDAAAARGNPEMLWGALQFVFANDDRLARVVGQETDPAYVKLIAALDLICATRIEGPRAVAALSREFTEYEAGRRLAVVLAGHEHAALRRAGLDALTRGLVEEAVAETAWLGALPTADRSELHFDTRSAVAPALKAFARYIWEDSKEDTVAPAASGMWVSVLTRELLRLTSREGMLDDSDVRLLERIAAVPGRAVVTQSVLEALRDHAAAHGNHRVVSILSAGHAGTGAVSAALRLLTLGAERGARRDTSSLETRIAERVGLCIARARAREQDELRSLLQPCESVVWMSLPNEDKIAIRGRELHVDRAALATLPGVERSEDDPLMAGVLYVIHEAVHLCQCIGDKARVAQLRATGAETTLMHVDLGADHVAAVFVADGVRDWSLHALKDLQGRSLSAFPTNAQNTTAARARKAQRLVGLRADSIARGLGLLGADADQYVFAEFGPAGGTIVLMRSGPPFGVLGVAPLSRDAASKLYGAAEPDATLAVVDHILQTAIASMLPSAPSR